MFRHLFVCLSKQRSWKAVFIGPNRICPRWQAFRRGHLLNLVLYRRDRGRIRATELGSGGYDRRSCNPRHAGFQTSNVRIYAQFNPIIVGPLDPVTSGAGCASEDAFADAFREVRTAYEAKYASAQHSASRRSLAFHPSSTEPELVSEKSFSRIERSVPGGFSDDSLPPFSALTHKPAKRRAFTWSAAVSIFAGLCVLGGLALYRTTTQPVSVTALGGMSVAGTPISAQANDGSKAAISLRRTGVDEPVGTQSPLVAYTPPAAPSQ